MLKYVEATLVEESEFVTGPDTAESASTAAASGTGAKAEPTKKSPKKAPKVSGLLGGGHAAGGMLVFVCHFLPLSSAAFLPTILVTNHHHPHHYLHLHLHPHHHHHHHLQKKALIIGMFYANAKRASEGGQAQRDRVRILPMEKDG